MPKNLLAMGGRKIHNDIYGKGNPLVPKREAGQGFFCFKILCLLRIEIHNRILFSDLNKLGDFDR
jgi:hypothetical protein